MIINLTQHAATETQHAAGVVDPSPAQKAVISRFLTVDNLPTAAELRERATAVADVAAASGASGAMIGGAGPLMRALRGALKARGITPLEAFSRRETVETTAPDGKVTKTATFLHAGWWPDVD